MARHNEIGKWGEQVAREFLVSNGWALTAENIRLGHNELDIVAMKDNKIAFIEVKTRSSRLADPLDAIDSRKISRLFRAADSFLRSYKIKHEPQIDIIVVIGTPETGYEIEHYPDALRPPLSGAY